MSKRRSTRVLAGIAWAIAAVLILISLRVPSGDAISPAACLEAALFCAFVLLGARLGEPTPIRDGRWRIPAPGLLVAGVVVTAALVAGLGRSTRVAWVALAAFEASILSAALPLSAPRRRAVRAISILLLAAAAGAVPMAAVELESRFAHEEIFVVLVAAALSATWLALWMAARRLFLRRPETAARGLEIRPGVAGAISLALALVGLAVGVVGWQRSFSPTAAPAFPGVSARDPFLCGESRPDPRKFDGRRVFADLLSRVEENPRKGPPETGMLALATGDPAWAGRFRTGLLEEARRHEFSRLGETKYWQYEAALRAYYFPRVRDGFAGLFRAEENSRLQDWFHAINQRALSRNLDDAIYALAFAKAPEGPYENQENGAALLALLEAGRLAAPELSARNRRYLGRQRRGWEARFRNSDDSYGYQSEWIQNAYFQSLASGNTPSEAMRRSFDWLLLQAEPDGMPPDYNAAVAPQLPGTAYLGSVLLDDPRLLWLAGRSLETFRKRGWTLPAQPGAERLVDRTGTAPSAGSCLLFADSGIPNRVGPLAPDKIVLRAGWDDPSPYLLWNLRFTGWHRYRGTNSIVAVRLGETVAGEKRGKPFSWLPLERRIFRDKRIPREFTNGLLVEADGFAGAVARLTGFGGGWAQDPPHFARVEEFRAGGGFDRAAASVSDWRGWSHRRTVHFTPQGPIVVLDQASGPSSRSSAIAWHVRGRALPGSARLLLGAGGTAELALVPLGESGGRVQTLAGQAPFGLDVLYRPARHGSLELASVFLPRGWTGARFERRRSRGKILLEIVREGERLSVPLP